ncbi:DNA primase [Nicoliella spurrieriana]|uniref:DNA primase n=1 Tax=Nicoliella spurrieriana TaxID=2925830 RepID=A0A976RRR4_9LACO|nr:DNA primase [Nicoliella spurrieriana]UQS86545.1 DNA primase [Nicoliella spurrieriana]
MARIPEAVIENVKNSVNITDVVSQYVQLKKSGKNLFGNCPFHEERTPSFSVSEDKQIFHCFSCGRGGNVFKFLMEIKNISFPEAVIEVAKMQNIKISDQYLTGPSNQAPKQSEDQKRLIDIHNQVARLYHHILVNTKLGEHALSYLHSRGLDDETIDEFQLGFAPQENLLQPFLKQREVDQQLMHASGLFIERDDGTLSDRFFNRVMYPIRNQAGQTIAFSGRVLDKQASQAKYLNSPETTIFSKRDVLFNLDKAKAAVRTTKDVILFEGFMDVISAFQAGVKNGIASMGTSFTDQQIHQIERITDHLEICYDGDEPGQKAINRAVDTLAHARLKLGVIQLPSGVDPDEYRKQNGDEQFQKMIQTARESPVTFKLRFLKLHRNFNRDEDRVDYLNDALAVIATVDTPVGRDVYVNQLVDQFQVDKQLLLDQINGIILNNRRKRRDYQNYNQHKQIDDSQMDMIQSQPQPKRVNKIESAEQFLLCRMLHDHDVWLRVASIDGFCFATDQYQMLYTLAEGYFHQHHDYHVDEFIATINEPSLKHLVVSLENLSISKQSYKGEIDDYVNIIMNEAPLENQIKAKQKQLVESTRTGNLQEQIKIGMDLIKLEQQKQQQSGRNQS